MKIWAVLDTFYWRTKPPDTERPKSGHSFSANGALARFRVLRFTDGDVNQNLEIVVHGIRNWIDENGI